MDNSCETVMMERIMTQADRWLSDHENEMIEDIRTLTSICSVTEPEGAWPEERSSCTAVLDAFLRLGKQRGFRTNSQPGLWGSLSLGQGVRTIGFWGHLDVVPAGENWLYPPFACTQIGRCLIGRGVQDNKGPVIAAHYAMRCIQELSVPVGSTILQFAGCAEESGMTDAVDYLRCHPAPDYSLVTDCAFPVCHGEKGRVILLLESDPVDPGIAGLSGGSAANLIPDRAVLTWQSGFSPASDRGGSPEPARSRTVCSLPSDCRWVTLPDGRSQIHAAGIAGHAAFPAGSINAIGRLCHGALRTGLLPPADRDRLVFIESICSSPYGEALDIGCNDSLFGRLTCVCSMIELINRRIQVTLDIRYPISADFDQTMRQITESADQHGFRISQSRNSPPYCVDQDSPLVARLMQVYRQQTGRDQAAYVMSGGTYARMLPNAVGFGPGQPLTASGIDLPPGHGSCHAPDELVSIDHLIQGSQIYVRSILALDDLIWRSKA